MIAGAMLDHVAVAIERWSDAWPRYAIELGGAWSSGGLNVGFAPAQLRYANGARVEILQPWQAEDNPFLRRFLDRHGPGPHHLTFKVPDLAMALDHAHDAGFTPVGVDLAHPDWKEAFLHPRQATGIVVQMAQATYAWESAPPEGFPTTRRVPPAALVRVTHAVADLDAGLALFEELLGGRLLVRGTAPDRSWEFADLAWPGPPAMRLVAPAPSEPPSAPPSEPSSEPSSAGHADGHAEGALGSWLGGLSGRLHHLAFALADDGVDEAVAATDVLGLLPAEGPARVIEPRDNYGTRLVLVDDGAGLDL
jgi:catechol 2,3-dioxygenase-like lactoylglutathione lyase family enzyme